MADVLFDFQISTPDGTQWWWPGPHGGGNAVVKYKSASQEKKTKPDGKDDDRYTYLGRKNAEISITVTWKNDRDANGGPGPIAAYVKSMFAAISPRGPNRGKAMAWVEEDQSIHAVDDVTVDELETTRTPGSGSKTASLKLSSWVKPKPEPVVTATPTEPGPWSPPVTKVANFTKRTLPGFSKNPPKVEP